MNRVGGVCRARLLAILQEVDSLSVRVQGGDKGAIDQVSTLVNSITESMIGHLPSPEECANMDHPVGFATIREHNAFSAASVFGLRKKDDSLPLHDHRDMYGFLKCLRGSVKIRTFTPIVDENSQDPTNWTIFRFESETIVDSSFGSQLICPLKDNLHEITAMEDGTLFFDVLLPGYSEHEDGDCSYYFQRRRSYQPLNPGDIVRLLSYRAWIGMSDIPYPTLP